MSFLDRCRDPAESTNSSQVYTVCFGFPLYKVSLIRIFYELKCSLHLLIVLGFINDWFVSPLPSLASTGIVFLNAELDGRDSGRGGRRCSRRGFHYRINKEPSTSLRCTGFQFLCFNFSIENLK